MALDPGERRIGVALGDELGLLASPFTVLARTSWDADLAAIGQIVEGEQVAEIVIGYPRTLRGEIGPQAQRAERFADRVREATGVPVRLWDERYTTAEAVERLGFRGGKRSRRAGRRGRPWPDAAAAAVILQEYLDSRR
jgi:putative Holliday junction resolvase